MLLGLTSKDAQLLADGAARRGLFRRLTDPAFGVKQAWVNITLLERDGTTHALFDSVLSNGQKGVEVAKAGPNEATNQVLCSVTLLRREHMDTNGHFCGLPPMGTMLTESAYCLPHDDSVLLIACAGFPGWRTNYDLSIIVAHELSLDLSRPSKQSAANA